MLIAHADDLWSLAWSRCCKCFRCALYHRLYGWMDGIWSVRSMCVWMLIWLKNIQIEIANAEYLKIIIIKKRPYPYSNTYIHIPNERKLATRKNCGDKGRERKKRVRAWEILWKRNLNYDKSQAYRSRILILMKNYYFSCLFALFLIFAFNWFKWGRRRVHSWMEKSSKWIARKKNQPATTRREKKRSEILEWKQIFTH